MGMLKIILTCVCIVALTAGAEGLAYQRGSNKVCSVPLVCVEGQSWSNGRREFSRVLTEEKYNELMDKLQVNDEKMAEMTAENEKMRTGIEELRAQLNGLDDKYSNRETSDARFRIVRFLALGACSFTYDQKCFLGKFVSSTGARPMNKAAATTVCTNAGGELANVYSEANYNQFVKYMRASLSPGQWHITAWIGMKAKVQTSQYTLRDGTAAPYLKWYLNGPSDSYPRGTGEEMALHIDRNPTATAQGMVTYGAAARNHGVICEMDLAKLP